MRRMLSTAGLLGALLMVAPAGIAGAQSATWVRGYPEIGPSGCVDYVAQWSDGTYTSTPWDCGPGRTAQRGTVTASRGYPQLAANGCTEYVTQWSDGTFTWVPFSCPPGVVYVKPSETGGPAAGAQTGQPGPTGNLPILQPIAPTPAPSAGTQVNWREYVVQRDGFAISLPQNWVRIDPRETGLSERPPEVFNLYKFLATDAGETAALLVLKGARSGENSINAIIRRNPNPASAGSLVNVTPVSEEEVTLPAGRALWSVDDVTIRRANGQTVTYRSLDYVIPVGDQVYVLAFDAEPAAFGGLVPVFDQIARSLRLL